MARKTIIFDTTDVKDTKFLEYRKIWVVQWRPMFYGLFYSVLDFFSMLHLVTKNKPAWNQFQYHGIRVLG